MTLSVAAQDAMAWRDMIAATCRTKPKLIEPSADESFIRSLGRAIESMRIVIWQREIFTLAQRGMENFIGLRRLPLNVGQKPLEPQFWFLNDFHLPISAKDCTLLNLPSGSVCEAFGLLADSRFGVFGLDFVICNEIPRMRLHRLQFPLSKATAGFAALLSFLHTELAATDGVVLPRSTRRRMARANEPIPDIRIVRLRKASGDANRAESDREWHHRWIVGGHWRRLPVPRKSDGALITFIRPYVKGPDSAPLLQPRETVYAVTQ